MREGKKQLALWLSEASMTRLKELATEERTTQADILERAIAQYQSDMNQGQVRKSSIQEMLDDHEARLTVLEDSLVETRHQLDSLVETRHQLDKVDMVQRDQQIVELHAQGVSGRQIAQQLGVGESTVRRALKRQSINQG